MKKSIKNILLIVLMISITGCLKLNQTFKDSNKIVINENLPTIDSKSIRTISDIQSIALEWKGFDIQNIFGYHIYRSQLAINPNKLIKVATLNSKYASHYLDTNLKENTKYFYSIAVIGSNNTQSNLSKPVASSTLNTLEPVSFSIAIEDLPRQVKVLWRPHENKSIKNYIIQRNDEEQNKWKDITSIENRLNAEYIDKKLKDNHTYSYRIISQTFDNIKSNPSKIIKAKTKALPNSTKQIDATQNVARKIIVSWTPSTNKDVVAYNIYSSRSENGYYTKLAKTKQNDNTFEDILNENNEKRYYKITAVDKDNLETKKNTLESVMGKTLELPKTPNVTLGLIKNETVIINWNKGDDRAIYYNVYKTTKEGFFKSKVKIFKNIEDTRFEDKDIIRGVQYQYELESVDENGLVSQKTTNIILSMPVIKIQKTRK